MEYYKELVLTKITQSGWELIEINDDTDWWLESLWEIRSVKNHFGLTLYMAFLVDSEFKGTNKSSAVWAISVYKHLPECAFSDSSICFADLPKGKFDANTSLLVKDIDKYRNLLNR